MCTCTFHCTVPNAVDGLTIITVNHSSVLVQWNPIPLIQVNGILLGYELIVTDLTNTEIYKSTVKSTSAIITGLGKFGCCSFMREIILVDIINANDKTILSNLLT